MKACIGLFVVAFLACLSALVGSTSNAHALSCVFTHQTVFADGQSFPPSISGSGCTESASATGPVGAIVSGDINLAANVSSSGTISGYITGQGNTTTNLGGQASFTIQAQFPTMSSVGHNVFEIGGQVYDLSSMSYEIVGQARATISDPQQDALGAFVSMGLSSSVSGAGQGSMSITCGNGFTVCAGVNQAWSVAAKISPPFFVAGQVVPIAVVMSEQLQLSTTANGGPGISNIDAQDPFNITSLEMLDANGIPIPGVEFVSDDGAIFTDAADTATPIPATLLLFASGIGGLSLLGRRRKTKSQALAA